MARHRILRPRKMKFKTPSQKQFRCKLFWIKFSKFCKAPRFVPNDELYLHSRPLKDVYRTPPNSFTIMPCRVPLYDDAVQSTVQRLYSDQMATKFIHKSGLGSAVSGTDSPLGRYWALMFPECLPERLEVVAYITELAILYDGVMEDSTCHSVKEDVGSAVGTAEAKARESPTRAEIQRLSDKDMLEILKTYGEEGQALLQLCQSSWRDMWAADVGERATEFEACISQRVHNLGMPAVWATAAFSLGVLLTPAESRLVQPLMDMVNRIIVQTNDYFSWQVDRCRETCRIFNVVLCIMDENHVSEEEAKARLRSYIKHDEQMYQSMLDDFHMTHPNVPNYLRRYIAAGTLLVGGNHHWSAVCPRYNPSKAPAVNQFLDIPAKKEGENLKSEPYAAKRHEQHTQFSSPDQINTVQTRGQVQLDDSALLAIPRYIQSLPSKNIRSKLVDAFNIWMQLPENQLSVVKEVISDLHSATLILDDIQDNSTLRRGSSAAHCIFGPAQCINSATYMVIHAYKRIYEIENPKAARAVLDGLTALAIGQSWDLNWKFNSYCPSITEYMSMIDGKTGAMFMILTQLMESMSFRQNWPTKELNRFAQLLGRWYQVRDDFQNLQDQGYSEQKGFCEDLDEGKFSYPVILCCNSDPVKGAIILDIFRQNRSRTPLARSVKMQILDLLRMTGALEETWKTVQQLEKEVGDMLSALEGALGKLNPSLRLITVLLGNIPPP